MHEESWLPNSILLTIPILLHQSTGKLQKTEKLCFYLILSVLTDMGFDYIFIEVPILVTRLSFIHVKATVPMPRIKTTFKLVVVAVLTNSFFVLPYRTFFVNCLK
jgi:hypothetical protein